MAGTDAALAAALGLLERPLPADATLATVHAVDERRARAGAVETAFVRVGERIIYVNTWTDAYRGAVKGDRRALVMLASTIAHEASHLDGGDERAAYAVQLEVLRTLSAREHVDVSRFIASVERARAIYAR